MNDEMAKLMSKAAELRRKGLTPEQEKRRKAVDARNAAIQAAGPRPVDGVTFGKVPKSK